jgi:hypothetical protein
VSAIGSMIISSHSSLVAVYVALHVREVTKEGGFIP